jgi:hypothetical protein
VTRAIGLEFAQEALGHTTLVATQNYWAGFNSDVKKEMADSLMNFDEAKPKTAARKKGALKLEEIQSKRKAARRIRLA